MNATTEDAIAALSSHLGMPLDFEDDACSINIGAQPFSIRRDEDSDRIFISALLADDIPEAPSRALVCDLLNLGFGFLTEGLPTVGRDPETGFIAALVSFRVPSLDPEEFPNAFDKFVAFAAALAERIDTERFSTPTSSHNTALEADNLPQLPPEAFLQV